MQSDKELEEQYGEEDWEASEFLAGAEEADMDEEEPLKPKKSLFPDDLEELPEEEFKNRFQEDL